ncbi:MAG: hypothetical protein H0U17_00310 [Actinobacteria bacterium]|nr:hypothetical protein [Actinomycetota bacterium]
MPPDAPGPPTVEVDVIDRHAAEFADEVPRRPAGSQQEQIAATYILGHLQQAGYPARLDGVPVGDLVRSTNVIAVPRGGAEPRYLVAVAYDTPEDESVSAVSIGVFLEVARALSVVGGDRPVEFVALGAEFAEPSEGHLGSRAMARLLTGDGFEPQIIYLSPELSRDALSAQGPLSEDLHAESGVTGDTQAAGAAEVFEEAGFEVTVVDGAPEVVARRLVEFLAGAPG